MTSLCWIENKGREKHQFSEVSLTYLLSCFVSLMNYVFKLEHLKYKTQTCKWWLPTAIIYDILFKPSSNATPK